MTFLLIPAPRSIVTSRQSELSTKCTAPTVQQIIDYQLLWSNSCCVPSATQQQWACPYSKSDAGQFRVAFAHFAIVFVHFALAHLAVLQLYLRILHCCNCICALFFDLDYSHSHCRGSDSHCSTTQIILLQSNSHRWGPRWAFIESLCHSKTLS